MIVLDTNAWIWWVSDPEKLSARARAVVAAAEKKGDIILSSISVWEVAVKHAAGKLDLDRDLRAWLRLATAYPGIRVEPITQDDAIESVLLPGRLHRDPADRFIVALSRRLGAKLVTRDREIRRYEHVETIW